MRSRWRGPSERIGTQDRPGRGVEGADAPTGAAAGGEPSGAVASAALKSGRSLMDNPRVNPKCRDFV